VSAGLACAHPAAQARPIARRVVDSLDRRALLWIATACLGYLALELLYVTRLPRVMDEFQGASAIEALERGIPYRDFRPYKTVLGYYLQWPAYQLGNDTWSRMLAVKIEMALLAALGFGHAALRLRRHYRGAAVVLAIAISLAMSSFLERSAALRVDMPTALVGLLSLLALLEGRTLRAGALAGLSFLVSQKGIYYAAAGGAALVFEALASGCARRAFRRGLLFGAAALAPVALYFALFAAVAGEAEVTRNVVARSQHIALDSLYAMRAFWWQTMSRNPGFYAAVGLALLVLLVQRRAPGGRGERNRLLLGYGVVLLGLCAWHKQPWPYFFVMLVPTGFVLATSLFDALLRSGRHTGAWLIVLLVFGLAWPLARVPRVLGRDNGFQRHMVEISEALLGPGDRYLAGLDFVPTHRQVHGLAWLDGVALARLAQADGPQIRDLVDRIVEARPRFVVWNYRIAQLPAPLVAGVRATYAPYFGNIRTYGPRLAEGTHPLDLWVGGRYALSGPVGGRVRIDGRSLDVGHEQVLAAGVHQVTAELGYRLHWLPEGIEERLDARYARPRLLFPDAYTY